MRHGLLSEEVEGGKELYAVLSRLSSDYCNNFNTQMIGILYILVLHVQHILFSVTFRSLRQKARTYSKLHQ